MVLPLVEVVGLTVVQAQQVLMVALVVLVKVLALPKVQVVEVVVRLVMRGMVVLVQRQI
jgi:hypothetical protein